jgi:hypothetical protein
VSLTAVKKNVRLWHLPDILRCGTDVCFWVCPQLIDATHSLNFSAGVLNPKV